MSQSVEISLDEVVSRVAGYVTLRGEKYPVKPIGAIGIQVVQRIPNEENRDVPNPATFDECFALAKKLCPTLPDDAWDESSEIIGLVIGISQSLVRRVQGVLPNSSGPVTNSPAPSPEG